MVRYFRLDAGFWNPQVLLQLTPLSWGFAAGLSKTHLGLRIGPLTIAIHWRISGFEARFETETRDRFRQKVYRKGELQVYDSLQERQPVDS